MEIPSAGTALPPELDLINESISLRLFFGSPPYPRLTEYLAMLLQSEERSESRVLNARVVALDKLCGAKCWQFHQMGV